MASSVLSASQVPDPSEAGLFDVPPRPRQRNYRHMGGKYTYVGLRIMLVDLRSLATFEVHLKLVILQRPCTRWESY